MTRFRKRVLKQAIRMPKGKTGILAIDSRYKNISEEFIDNFNINLSYILDHVGKGLYNIISGFKNLWIKAKLDNNVLNRM